MQAMLSPLRLDRYFLKELHFTLNEGFDRGKKSSAIGATPPDMKLSVVSAEQNPTNPLQWRFELKIILPPDPEGAFPYTFSTVIVGYFTVSDKFPAARAEEMARANGPALLYSGARELVRSVTGRGPYPPVVLPSVTFIQPKTEEGGTEKEQKQLSDAEVKLLSEGNKASPKKASKNAVKKRGSKKAS